MIYGFSIYYLISIVALFAVLWRGIVFLLKKRQGYRKAKKNMLKLNLSLAACMVLLFMLFAEVTFALFYVQTDAFNMTSSSKRWFNLYLENQRNESGWRDSEEFVKRLPDDQKRICFIGDSFTVGHGIRNINNRFSNLIEEKLNKNHPGKYQVANLADPGLEISQIEARTRGVFQGGYQVDHLVYVMCLNDIEGYDTESKENLTKLGDVGPRNFVLKNSYLPNWLYFRYLQYTRKEVRDYYPHLKKSYDSFAWTGFSRKFKSLSDLCKSKNVQFSVVIFPFLHDLNSESSFISVHKKVEKFCKKNHIPVVDLEPVMRKHADENLVVNRFDAHPNEKANQYAAEAIYNALLKTHPQKKSEEPSSKEDSK